MSIITESKHMPARVQAAFQAELAAARSAAPVADRWRALERAHVLSQPWPGPHVRAHAVMVALAVQQRDAREIIGQLGRLVVAGPASALGRYPAGNTGRARVSATKPMAMPDDLAALLESVTAPTG